MHMVLVEGILKLILIFDMFLLILNIYREPDIPPNATLVYHVQLKDVNDVTLMNAMNAIERLSMALVIRFLC
jgi:hypothetical protein